MLYIPKVQPDERVRRYRVIPASLIPPDLRSELDAEWCRKFGAPLPLDRSLKVEVSFTQDLEPRHRNRLVSHLLKGLGI